MSSTRLLLFVGLLAVYGAFLMLAGANLPVDGDEAKYYTNVREVLEGGIPLIDFHPGSTGFYFYYLHAFWGHLFGIGYEVGRAFNIVLTIGALASVFFGLRRIFESDFVPFFWLIAFVCNPFFASHSIQIIHYAQSNALMLMAFGLMLFYVKGDRTGDRAVMLITLVATALALAANIRGHLWLVWVGFAVFLVVLSKPAGSRTLLKLLGAYLLTSAFITVIPLIAVKSIDHGSFLSEKHAGIAPETYPKAEETGARAPGSSAFDQNRRQLLEVRQLVRKIKVGESLLALQSMLKQTAGFEVNGQHVYYLIPLILSLIYFRELKGEKRLLFLFSLLLMIGVGISIFLFRYSLSSSFSYFIPPLQFLLIAALFGVDLIGKKLYEAECRPGLVVIAVILGLAALQNLVFLRPVRQNDSPTYSIYKHYGSEANSVYGSLFNIKHAAIVANKYLRSRDDYFMASEHTLSPMLIGTPFPGTIMNSHDDFYKSTFWDLSNENDVVFDNRTFLKRNWYVHILRPSLNPTGTNASYMVNVAVKHKRLALIIDNGRLHRDFLPVLQQYYRLADQYGVYKFYVPK